MRQLSHIIFLIVCILPASCKTVSESLDSQTFYMVLSVTDGDTFRVDDGSKKGMKVRLIGIDAPETRRSNGKDIGFYGSEACDFLENMISGRKVRLEYDIQKFDPYKRVLAYAYLEDGTFINAELIRHGYARLMTIPPNVRYADEFVRYQQKARRNNKGIWQRVPQK